MRNKKNFPIWLILIVLLIFLGNRLQWFNNISEEVKVEKGQNGFSRDASLLIYSNHAKCRMGCRHIEKHEVEEILEKGTVNYGKSDLKNPRDRRYALEGVTSDRQRVRLVIAPENNGTVVVTVIDLDTDWPCNCN